MVDFNFIFLVSAIFFFVLVFLSGLTKKLDFFDDRMYLTTHTMFPFWNTQLGSTRNMSYDLRGDVPINPIGKSFVGPWNISSTVPIYNKPLWMVS